MSVSSDTAPEREEIHPPKLKWLAVAFIALGVISLLAPQIATLAASALVASAMLIWGGLGLWFSLSVKDLPEWKLSAVAFGLMAVLGLAFIAFPAVSIEVMTLFLTAGFLAEGVLSIVMGMRMSGRKGAGWLIGSGVASLALGLVILLGWPSSAATILGLVFGVNFLTTGFALLALRDLPQP